MTTPDTQSTLSTTTEITGVTLGQAVPAKTSITFNVKITFHPSGSNGNYGGDVTIETEPDEGIITGTLNTSTGDLTTGHSRTSVSTTFLNSYDTQKTVTLSLDNNNFEIVDSNDNPLSTVTINANTDNQAVNFYIKLANGARFASSPQNVNVLYTPSGGISHELGTIAIAVDVDPSLNDTEPPTITSFLCGLKPTTNNGNLYAIPSPRL